MHIYASRSIKIGIDQNASFDRSRCIIAHRSKCMNYAFRLMHNYFDRSRCIIDRSKYASIEMHNYAFRSMHDYAPQSIKVCIDRNAWIMNLDRCMIMHLNAIDQSMHRSKCIIYAFRSMHILFDWADTKNTRSMHILLSDRNAILVV